MIDREYIRTRARYWRTSFAPDSRHGPPVATAWREERERRTGSTRPYNGRRSFRTPHCRGRVFERLEERPSYLPDAPCHVWHLEEQRRERYGYYYTAPVHTFDDWGDGPICVRCGQPKEGNP